MIIQHLAKIETEASDFPGMAGVTFQGILMEHPLLPGFLVRMFTLEPKGHTGLHHHPQQHLHYITRGQGDFVGDAGRRQQVSAGDIVLTEPDEVHQIANASEHEPLQFFDVVGHFVQDLGGANGGT